MRYKGSGWKCLPILSRIFFSFMSNQALHPCASHLGLTSRVHERWRIPQYNWPSPGLLCWKSLPVKILTLRNPLSKAMSKAGFRVPLTVRMRTLWPVRVEFVEGRLGQWSFTPNSSSSSSSSQILVLSPKGNKDTVNSPGHTPPKQRGKQALMEGSQESQTLSEVGYPSQQRSVPSLQMDCVAYRNLPRADQKREERNGILESVVRATS